MAVKKKTKKKESKKQQSTVALFLQALATLYPKDKLAPGVVLAWLPGEEVFYASVARYESVQQKEILLSVKESGLESAISELISSWWKANQPAIQLAQRLKVRRRTKR